MSIGFTEGLLTVPKLEAQLDQLNMGQIKDLTRLVKLLWVEKFNLPPNDVRLSQLTLREAAEQVFEQQAFGQFMDKRAERKRTPRFDFDEGVTEAEVRTDEEARVLADTPHLTGDPEWDAIELAETDPRRPLLSERLPR